MNERSRSNQRMLGLGLGLTLALLLLALLLSVLRLRTNPARATALPVYGQVADFLLTNHHGQAVSLSNLLGRVWIADIVFTRCAGPCPRMTQKMAGIQAALDPAERTRLVTLTTDPDFDTPEVLRAYAQRFNADPARWMFLTGTKAQIARLAVDSLKLTTVEKRPEERESPEDLFIHSTIFVVVDRQGRLRGIFETEGEGIDSQTVTRQVLATARRLERER
ncbi:MAG TPA: SCO family protein [Verrucomicrobiota bacterium]|nr:SCO family protein [Verrucomicrobiota bacterium]HRT06794.1 SCO family protein [Candidatus Paceibacterota bacterium]HRT58841.1 SCO family protein [Candidatus Paceibacterota bacterium]